MLKPEDRAVSMAIAQSIIRLSETEAWKHYEQFVINLAEKSIPEIAEFTDQEATRIASRVAYASGLKRALDIVKQQKRLLASFEEQIKKESEKQV